MQRQVLEQNFLVERVLLGELERKLRTAEADHYRLVQPDAAARTGLGVIAKQIRDARPLLEQLSRDVPARLRDKPTLLVWGMRDMVYRGRAHISRMCTIFTDLGGRRAATRTAVHPGAGT
ncbi:hypothetical protein ACQPXH_08945 [Nocardia sp. CA-135953]|uniref:hypothetical protein n=1 Tax=Nocardia sp. CA-135953 TaxID=3239978 RepID=UPI003D96324F